MTDCKHKFIRKGVYHWMCNKCDETRLSLILLFTPEFAKIFLDYGWRAYHMYKGEIYSEIK